ncbi:MAG: porin [Prosthecobacter sp.]
MSTKLFSLITCVILAIAPQAFAQAFLDTVDDKMSFQSAALGLRADLSMMADATVYAAEQPAQGLLYGDDHVFFAPRLITFLDVNVGSRVLLHGQMRVDRGFDPASASGGQVRLDEYFLQLRLGPQEEINLRLGKFATAFGSWPKRNLSWDNPLVTAPMAYEDMLPMTDGFAPGGLAGFAARRDMPDNKRDWVPIVWGPSYATGLSLFGRVDVFEYAFEVKNAGIASRPQTWDGVQDGFRTNPTFTGRVGLRPAPEWTLGTSFSHGPYMTDIANRTLPAGTSVNDFTQTTWGIDAGYAHRKWQLWSELLAARFEVPRVGDVDVLSGYVEAKYKITPQLWAAARWNQSVFSDVPGLTTGWDRDAWRFDLALGYRFTEHLQLKLQYSVGDKDGPDQEGDHLGAMQLTVKF